MYSQLHRSESVKSLQLKHNNLGYEFSDLSYFSYSLYFHTFDLSQKGERNRRHFLFKSISWPIGSTAAGTVHPSFRSGSVESASTYRLKISTSPTHCFCDLGIKREPEMNAISGVVSAITYSCHLGLQHKSQETKTLVCNKKLWSAKNKKLWSATQVCNTRVRKQN